jgi:hypothetical protein
MGDRLSTNSSRRKVDPSIAFFAIATIGRPRLQNSAFQNSGRTEQVYSCDETFVQDYKPTALQCCSDRMEMGVESGISAT